MASGNSSQSIVGQLIKDNLGIAEVAHQLGVPVEALGVCAVAVGDIAAFGFSGGIGAVVAIGNWPTTLLEVASMTSKG